MFNWFSKQTQSKNFNNNRKIIKEFVVLLILDGLGVHTSSLGNALLHSKTPFLDTVWSNGISTLINASGTFVGLPKDEPGNSEVGHLTIGTGKLVQQSLTKINDAITSGKFNDLPVLKEACAEVKKRGTKLHLMGILSAGGVHGHIEHLYKLLDICKSKGVHPYIHAFLDGRDTGMTDGYFYVSKLRQKLLELGGNGTIASVCGRFYAMDRDSRWERTQLAYECMIGNGKRKSYDVFGAIQQSYKNAENDQIFTPTTIVDGTGNPVGPVKDGDVVIFFNYREDRARQITKAFVDKNIEQLNRPYMPKDLFFVTMTGYEENLKTKILFQPKRIEHSLSSVIAENGLNQIHISETEKHAHVTYFFNGGVEAKHTGEKWFNIPSQKVFDYAKTPEMSAQEITDQAEYSIMNMSRNKFSFMIINYANPDMLGHTGEIDSTAHGIEFVDQCVNTLVTQTVSNNGAVVIIADHGNCETMVDRLTLKVDTAHTNNPVPFILVHDPSQLNNTGEIRKIGTFLSGEPPIGTGMLADVAPTILNILNLPIPSSMDGEDLLKVL